MSIVATRIAEIVKLRLAPLLKSNGFTKSGRDFHRRCVPFYGEDWLDELRKHKLV